MPLNPEQVSTWITVQDNRVCPDCEKLAGKTMTMGDWIASGVMPGNGQTICQDFCRCIIVPEEWAGDFGETKTVDIGLEQVNEIFGMTEAANITLRWEVIMESEVGLADNAADDMAATIELYNVSPNELAANFPKRFNLIKKILGI